ncbi:MAG: N-acetyl-gamma-glutamyl-phosphate reductase [Gammaproteobacteria bacterium]
MTQQWPTIVLGGTGYVAGEFVRLTLGHPNLKLTAVVSTSEAGAPLAKSFAHLEPALDGLKFVDLNEAIAGLDQAPHWCVLCAAPHGAAAGMLKQLAAAATQTGAILTMVDASADFRFESLDEFESIYDQPHGAPELASQFSSGLPEHVPGTATPHIGHPGCFATAMLLGVVPLLQHDLIDGAVFVAAVTGSTGSGRSAKPTTHHPERNSNFVAYNPLRHRHSVEVEGLAELAIGKRPQIAFVPHSGPFARGIHATLQAKLNVAIDQDELLAKLGEFYADAAFVQVSSTPPRIKDVVGTNYTRISAAVEGNTLTVFVVLDNLVKGAAGGSIQWANRLLGLPETTGLTTTSLGWT